jgi:hypothetical protein
MQYESAGKRRDERSAARAVLRCGVFAHNLVKISALAA